LIVDMYNPDMKRIRTIDDFTYVLWKIGLADCGDVPEGYLRYHEVLERMRALSEGVYDDVSDEQK